MSLLTIEFIGVLLAAWKAPGWVKEAGLLALVTGIFASLLGFYIACGDLSKIGDIYSGIIWSGIKVSLITTLYGIIIYIVSLAIRIIQKPKLL